MDYSYLDVLLDSVFILDANKSCIYCNEAAAALCNASVKRITRGKPIFDFIQFSDKNLFIMPEGEKGKGEIFPLSEIDYFLPNNENKKGKVQLSISPFSDAERWVVVIRDVTVEEVLHEKHKKQLEQLEAYSKNLEKMVEERTVELKKANNMLSAIMNSLGQGFLVFDEEGQCSDIYTKACEDVLESEPAGKNIVSILNCTDEDKEQFEMWMKAIFSNSLPFDSLRELGPATYQHSKGKFVTLDFFAIHGEGESIQNIVLVATDKTAEKEANEALLREREKASMIVKFVTNKKPFSNFIDNFSEQFNYLEQQVLNSSINVDEIFRVLHTIEGEAASLSISTIKLAAKGVQEVISELRKNQANSLVDCKDDYVLSLKNLGEEFDRFLSENKVIISALKINNTGEFIEISKDKVLKFYKLFKKLNLDKDVIDSYLTDFYKTSFEKELQHANNILSQVSAKQGKLIKPIKFIGGDIKVDSDHLGGLFSSMVHIFRNIVDHGLESPEARIDAGKDEYGHVTIKSEQTMKNDLEFLKLTIEDDGMGIDPAVIREKLSKTKPQKNWENFGGHEVIQEIFNPGFSSREEAGEFSGRGVGMDAVKTEVLKLNGFIEAFSQLGKGTTIIIEVPLNGFEQLDKIA